MLSAHYRSPINYSAEIMEQSVSALERLYNCRENLEFLKKNASEKKNAGDDETLSRLSARREQFRQAMDDDLNTADAVAAIFELVRDINSAANTASHPSEYLADGAEKLFDELCGVLGILYEKKDAVDDEIRELAAKRQQARKNRDFRTADAIRDEISRHGYILEDSPQGVRITRK